MQLIKLTAAMNSNMTGPVYINPDAVGVVFTNPSAGTVINSKYGDVLAIVGESATEVARMLETGLALPPS